MECENTVRIKNFLRYGTEIFIKHLHSDHRKNVLKVLLTLDG